MAETVVGSEGTWKELLDDYLKQFIIYVAKDPKDFFVRYCCLKEIVKNDWNEMLLYEIWVTLLIFQIAVLHSQVSVKFLINL